jgi:hypothetical protein
VILACLVAAGCASTGAPGDWLPVAEDAPSDPYGAWVRVEFVKPYDDRKLMGEFLAVDDDSLYILTGTAGTVDPVIGISLDMVRKARIAHFDPQTSRAAGWVALGSLSSLSHGIIAGVTLPIWILGGSALASTQAASALENYPDLPWASLRMYARFPQGPPPGLHELRLRPRSEVFAIPTPQPRTPF